MSAARVNRPTDIKAKEEDVNRKLQFYGIASAFQVGKVPSNEQIDIALNSFLKSQMIANPSNKLSAEGRALTADFRKVVEEAKYLLLSKNEGNLLQDFIWQSQKVDGGNAALPGAPIDKETAKQHGNQALEGLRTLGTLILSNGQFRKLLNDAVILLRDIAGDAAVKAADKVNPSEDQLNQIDKPADGNTWHDVPDMSAGNIKSQIKNTYNQNKPLNRDDVRDAAGNATEAAHPDGSRDPRDAAALAGQDQRYGTASGVDAQSGAQNGVATLKQRASENVDEDTKQKGRETRDRTKNYLSKKMPEERREQVIWRLKKLVVECQGHPDYQQAITTLLDLAEQYASHANNVTQQSAGTVKGAHADGALQRAEADLRELIERFANYTSMDDLFDSLNNIYKDADRDPELKTWFKKMDAYIRKCLKQQGYIMEDSSTDEWNRLYDQGNFLLRDRYRNHTDRIVDELKFMADQFDKDPQNHQFAQSMQKLFNDLGNDENGKPTFKPHLVKDLTEVILPQLFSSIRYVPIPRIEYSDPMIDAVVENLVIESDNLMPNVFEIAGDHYSRYGRMGVGNKKHHSFMISVSGIQMDLRDVSYYVKKKQGFPSITDLGVADIFLGGSGFSFKMKMSSAHKTDRQNFFKVDKVDVDVKNFNIKLKQSKHKLLFGLVKPIMLKVIRPALQKVIEKQIKDQFHQLDQMAYKIKQEADRAQKELERDPENAPNIYQRYVNAAQKQISQGKQKAAKAQDAVADKKANVAMTKHDSIFPNIHLPGGISSKATEYKDLALKGGSWESPIFKLGGAGVSSDIPRARKVERKSHSVTTGGVRGPQNIGNTGSMSQQAYDPSAQSATGAGGYGNSGYSTGASTGAGYGTTSAATGAGYGAAGAATGAGYGTTGAYSAVPSTGATGTGLTSGSTLPTSDPSVTHNTTGFSNQVDQALNGKTAGATTGTAAGTNGSALNGSSKLGGTTLGAHNPVFSGSV